MDLDLLPGSCALLEPIKQLGATLDCVETELNQPCRERYPEGVGLEQGGGVDHIASIAFVRTLEDPTRFAESRTVRAYLGLCPRQPLSGDREPQLRITKAGDVMLRRDLVRAAHASWLPSVPTATSAAMRYGSASGAARTQGNVPPWRGLAHWRLCSIARG